ARSSARPGHSAHLRCAEPDVPPRTRGGPLMDSRGFPSRPHDRLAWLWLAIGACLLPFASFQTVWPIATWLPGVFLLRFVRTQRLRLGVPVSFLVLCVALAIGWRNDFIPLPLDLPVAVAALIRGTLVVVSALFAVLPYVVDRLIATRLSGVAHTLVFPLTSV